MLVVPSCRGGREVWTQVQLKGEYKERQSGSEL